MKSALVCAIKPLYRVRFTDALIAIIKESPAWNLAIWWVPTSDLATLECERG